MEFVYAILAAFVMSVLILWTQAGMPRKGETIKKALAELRGRKKATGLLLLGCAAISLYGSWLFGLCNEYLGFLLLAAYLLAITPGDIREHSIPDRATLLFAILFALYQAFSFNRYVILNAGLGAVAGALALGLPYLLRRDSVGLGDVKAVMACGLALGFPNVLYFILRAFLLLFVYSVVQLLRKKASLKTETPFAPFLLVAALV